MKKGSIIAFSRSKGTSIICKEGSLWLTEPGSVDIHLKNGEKHEILSSGKIVMKAMTSCRFEIL
jgi:hypothetical protein